jgi:hypothetical protein
MKRFTTQMRALIAGGLAICLWVDAGEIGVGQTQPSVLPQSQPSAVSADDLPDAMLHGELFAVVALDFKTGDKQAWYNAWAVVSGGTPTTRPLGPNDSLPPGIEQGLGPLYKIGAERFGYCVSLQNRAMVGTMGIRLAPGSNANAAIVSLNKSIRADFHFDQEGNWLINRQRLGTNSSVPALSLPISPRADEIRRDLNTWGDDVPVKVVYVTSDALKRNMMSGGSPPDEIAPVADLFWKAQFIYVGVRLGMHPAIRADWVAPDADGADAVIKQFAIASQRLKQPNNGTGIPPFMLLAFDQFQPVRKDNVVSLMLNQKDLSSLFMKIVAGMMSQQNSNPRSQAPPQTPVAADWAPTDPATDSAAAQMRLIVSAIIEYDRAHQSLPVSLDDLLADKLLPGAEVFHDPRTGKDNGFVYMKPPGVSKLSDITTAAKPAILYESKDGAADPNGLIGYADGYVGIGRGSH